GYAAEVEAVGGKRLLARKSARSVDEQRGEGIIRSIIDRAVVPSTADLRANIKSSPAWRQRCWRRLERHIGGAGRKRGCERKAADNGSETPSSNHAIAPTYFYRGGYQGVALSSVVRKPHCLRNHGALEGCEMSPEVAPGVWTGPGQRADCSPGYAISVPFWR